MGKNQYWALCGNPGQVVKIWNKSLNALSGWMYTIHGSTSTKNQVHFIYHPSLKQIRQIVYKSKYSLSVSHCILYTLHKQQKQWNNDHWFIPSLEFSAPNFFGVKIGPLPQLRSSCHVTVSFSFLHFWPEPAHCPVHFQCSLSSSLSVLLPSDAAVFFLLHSARSTPELWMTCFGAFFALTRFAPSSIVPLLVQPDLLHSFSTRETSPCVRSTF